MLWPSLSVPFRRHSRCSGGRDSNQSYRLLGLAVLYFGKPVPSVSEENVSSIFRAEQYFTLKTEAARSSETLDANFPHYMESHSSNRVMSTFWRLKF